MHTGINHADFWKQYTTSLYWSLSTLSTVGYGDITPSTDEEKVLSMVVMLFGSVLYATIIGNVANCAFRGGAPARVDLDRPILLHRKSSNPNPVLSS